MPAGFQCLFRTTVRRAFAGFRLGAWTVLAAAAGLPAGRAETLTLADCLRETLEHSPAVVEQRLNLEQAAGDRLIFRSRALPTVGLSGLAGQQGEQTAETLRIVSKNASGQRTTTTVVNARPANLFLIGSEALNQSIFDAAIPASWRRGDIAIASAKANFLVVATTQLHTARTLFYQALYQQESGALLREIADSLAANVRGEGQLVQAGLAGRQALLAAQVQQVNFQPGIFNSTGTFRTSLTSLFQIMGRPLGRGTDGPDTVILAGPWEDADVSFDPAAVARETRARRPDIVALRDVIRAYTEDANIARGGYYPRVQIYVTGDVLPENFVRSDRPNSVRPGDDTRQTEVRPGIREDWNVIDTGTVLGSVRQLESLRATLDISLHQSEQNIPSELAGVRAQLDAALRTQELLAANVTIAADTLRMISAGIAQGTNSQLEFLDAQNGVLSTRTGLLAAKLRLSVAHADYDRVTGGYLRFVSEDRPSASPAPK